MAAVPSILVVLIRCAWQCERSGGVFQIRVVKAFQAGLDRREPSLTGPSAARLREITRQLKLQVEHEGKPGRWLSALFIGRSPVAPFSRFSRCSHGRFSFHPLRMFQSENWQNWR